jgi:hypothetical protein
MGIEDGGFLGLIVLIADIWSIVKTIGSPSSAGSKALWIVLILALPVVGTHHLAGCRTQSPKTLNNR